ncbi:helix-turn-helix domain-containing protein [Streptosporangium lutulentum]
MTTLQDPVRRAVYDYVAAQGREVGRNEAAEAVGVQRTLAAFHLDKLVEAGLLEANFRRLTEKTGPGSGRRRRSTAGRRGSGRSACPPGTTGRWRWRWPRRWS